VSDDKPEGRDRTAETVETIMAGYRATLCSQHRQRSQLGDGEKMIFF
jgi:hypothetical protein